MRLSKSTKKEARLTFQKSEMEIRKGRGPPWAEIQKLAHFWTALSSPLCIIKTHE